MRFGRWKATLALVPVTSHGRLGPLAARLRFADAHLSSWILLCNECDHLCQVGMREQLGDCVVFRSELLIREHCVHGMMTIAADGERRLPSTASRDEMVVGGMHVRAFAKRAGQRLARAHGFGFPA